MVIWSFYFVRGFRVITVFAVTIFIAHFEAVVLLSLVLSRSSENPWYYHYPTLCIILDRSKLQLRPLDHRMPPNTRAASCKPALALLKVLINLRLLVTPKMPINLINSVILRTQSTQNNTNHLLGFRGMRTWPCVDATQIVIMVGV
jgi:hypothetical protein